jgi:hypothetical protein
MAVKQIYPTNIYLKQLDIGDEKLTIIENYLRAQHLAFTSSLDNDHSEYTDGNENIVIDAIIEGECPEMAELIEEIKKGFLSLAYSNIDNMSESNADAVMLDVELDSCKINLMKKGYRLGVHTHYSDDAFACLYFNDVTEDEGGEIVLYDPRWQRNYAFGGSKLEKIKSKRGQLLIAPQFLWHEVTQYNGNEERLTLVVNAQVVNRGNELRNKRTKYTV